MVLQTPISCRRAFVLLGIAVFLVYGNTFDCSWHLDDFHNIVENNKVQISELNPGTLASFFRAIWGEGWLNRPIAFTSLAINWYFGVDNPFGYHIFNLAIHILAAFFLYLTFARIFQTPRLAGTYTAEQAGFVSLLAAFLWALNPIQTQAVTYVVQRMTSMSALFCILAVYFYLSGRLSDRWQEKSRLFLYCLLSFSAAFLCKENAATLPLSLLLAEAVFFLDLTRKKTIVFFLVLTLAIVAAGIAVGGYVFFGGDALNVLRYDDRPFTPWERLLSQPRALILYLSLILYPAPTRLSITHDFEVSTSLFHPLTTLPSLLAVVGLIAIAVWRIRRWPLLSYAILFFFFNHAIESGIIGLELVFEHRNYLPSMFVFLAAAAGVVRVLEHFRCRSRIVSFGLRGFIPLLLVGLGTGAYVRNQAWASEKTLWEDAIAKAPGESRPYHILAAHHYDRIGDFDMSMRLYKLSLTLRKSRLSHEALIYNNMAAIQFRNKDFDRAAEFWKKSVDVYPRYNVGRYNLAVALMKNGSFDEALGYLDEILKENLEYSKPRNLQGMILIAQKKYYAGLASFGASLKRGVVNRQFLINVGAAYHYLGDHAKAGAYLREALKMAPKDRTALAWLAQNHIRAGAEERADELIGRLLATSPAVDLRAWLDSCILSRFAEDDILPPDLDEGFHERLRKAWLQAAGGFPERPPADAPQPDPIE